MRVRPDRILIKRAIHGGLWLSALRVANVLFRATSKVVIARLLAPHDFGLMGVALLVMTALEQFSKMGFDIALVQNRGDIDKYLDTAWTLQVIRGIILFLVLFGGAPLVATFFDSPKANLIIRVIAFTQLLRGLRNIAVVYFPKKLEYNKEFVYQISGTVANVLVAILIAIIFRNVWALVFGALAGDLALCVMSYITHPYRPNIKLDWEKGHKLFAYGKWVFAYTIVGFLSAKGADIYLGKVLGLTTLAFYQMAFFVAMLVKMEIADMISEVTFPVWSILQDDMKRLKDSFLSTAEMMFCLVVPISVGLFLLSNEFTLIIFGEKWSAMGPALQILSIVALLETFSKFTSQLFKARGRPSLVFWLNLTRVGVIALLIVPLTDTFEMKGAVFAVLSGSLVCIPLWWYKSSRTIEITSIALFKRTIPALSGAFMMILIIESMKMLLVRISVINFLSLVSIGALTYLGFLMVLWKKFKHGPFSQLSLIINNYNKESHTYAKP